MKRLLAALLIATCPAWAEGERAGAFEYYVLALSWTPTWCALEGDARQSPQCDADRGYGFTLHGLWPQNARGWPSYCRTPHREATRGETGAMADIMGSAGLAWHQWKKHGRCSGLSAADYFALSRAAYGAVARPDVLRKLDRAVRLPARVVEEAFLEANPELAADQITITCKAGRIQEVRLCLTRDGAPRTCGADVSRDCRATDALFDPIR
ncbi:MAG: ribonuclease T2 [Pseudomonadota bacterium]